MLLALESSAKTASVALLDDDYNVINHQFINAGLTHSETLLPMVEKVMENCNFSDINTMAVSVGPGSFTGVRIGVATVKGLAFNNQTNCIGVSTLDAIAHNFLDQENSIICPVMDARRMQFYNAMFKIQNGKVIRLCDDRLITIDDLKDELSQYSNVIVAGDGGKLCCDSLNLDNVTLADDERVYQNAIGVALSSKNYNSLKPSQLVPVYLRLSQAERELKLKLKRG